MKFHRILIFSFFFVSLCSLPTSQADEIQLISGNKDRGRIQQLDLYTRDIELEYIDSKGRAPASVKKLGEHRVLVKIPGRFDRSGWTLLINGRGVRRDSDGSFAVKTVMYHRRKRLALIAVGPKGQVAAQEMTLLVPNWNQFIEDNASVETKLRYHVGTGMTYLSHNELSLKNGFTQLGITAKMGISRNLSRKWSAGVSGYFNALSLNSNSLIDKNGTSLGQQNPKYYGLNLRLGYRISGIREPWKFQFMVGAYLLGMLRDSNDFGYDRLAGPQIYPALSYQLNKGKKIDGYLKLTPLDSNTGPMSFASFKNLELAGGLQYSWSLGKFRQMGLTLDASSLNLVTFGGELQNLKMQSLSLGIFYGF